MIHASNIRGLALAAGSLCIISVGTASAQAVANCPLQPAVSATRQTLNCEAGLSVIVERGAHYRFADRNHDGRADALILDSKAALVDVDRNRIKGGFEVVTPQAIAAVRGTRWAVDAQRGKTSVLVLRGRVDVSKISTGQGVTLGRGQGVDVDRTRTSLRVNAWAQSRINALIARLAQ